MDPRDVTSYDIMRLIQQLQDLQDSINGLNATVIGREVDLVYNAHSLLNQTLSYTSLVVSNIMPVIDKVNAVIPVIITNINHINDALTIGGMLKLSAVFFAVAMLFIITTAIVIIEWKRWRHRNQGCSDSLLDREAATLMLGEDL